MRLLTLIILAFATTFVSAKSIKISGKIVGGEDKKTIFIYQVFGPEIKTIDSAAIKSEMVAFKLNAPYRGMYKIGYNSTNNTVVILGEEDFEFEVTDNKFETLKIKNSKENEAFTTFNMFNAEYVKEVQNLQNQINAARTLNARNPSQGQEEIKRIQDAYMELLKKRAQTYNTIIKDNNSTYTAKLCSTFLKADSLQKDNFFASFDINDIELRNSDVFMVLANTYFQRFFQNSPNNLAEAQRVVNSQKESSEQREALYLAFIPALAANVSAQDASKLGRSYRTEYPNSPMQKSISTKLPALPIDIGDMAPEIELANPKGEMVKLSSTRGKVVLLDFWASWCGPCRGENPNVVKAYRKFKDKGFTVFSVSLDKAEAPWLAAIQKDQLEWDTHVSDLKGWGSAGAKIYNVTGIPATFLLDKDGRIIAKNLRGQALDDKLEELLGK